MNQVYLHLVFRKTFWLLCRWTLVLAQYFKEDYLLLIS
jgi:hypothetical protein